MHFKKNGAVISVIVLLLCVAVYLNWTYSRVGEAAADTEVDAAAIPETEETASDGERFQESQWVIELAEDGGQTVTQAAATRLAAYGAYFDETRLERQTTRDQELSILKDTLSQEGVTEEMRVSAEEQIAAIAACSVTESRIESLVTAKGFLDCVAMISDAGVSVVVLPEMAGLQASDVAKIKDIVIQETDVTADLIRVIESQ